MRERLRNLKTLVAPLIAFFIGTALTCCAYSMLSSTLAIRLAKNGAPSHQVGLVLAFYYLGSVLASMTAHGTINRVGHIRTFSTFIAMFSALVLMHYFSQNLIIWAVLRLLQGYCMGGAAVCLESWLNARANNKNRGTIIAFYMITTYLGASIGQLMVNVPDGSGAALYIIVSVLFSIALVPIGLTALPAPDISAFKNMKIRELYKISPVGVVGCLVSGFLVGAFYTMSPTYIAQRGYGTPIISLFMFFGIFGAMLAQLPIGRLSDKMDRRYVLIGIGVLVTIISLLIHPLISYGAFYIAIGAMLLGSCIMVIYPICISHINDLVEDTQRVRTSGLIILLQGIGLIIGPIVVSFMIEHFGTFAFLASYSVAGLLFVAFVIGHVSIKPTINYVSVTPTDPIPLDPSPVFEELATDDTMVDRMKKSRARKSNKI